MTPNLIPKVNNLYIHRRVIAKSHAISFTYVFVCGARGSVVG
jgi:hypothetical protein